MIGRATIAAGLALAGLTIAAAQARAPENPAERTWLAAHNAERAAFGVAPLRWSEALEAEARDWARQLARENRLRHSSRSVRGQAGENLWMGTAGAYRPDQMIDHFAAERRHFRPGTFPRVSRTGNWTDVGHFTQMVWAETREVGCATARSRQFDVLVCRYWPGGNVIGERVAPGNRIARR